MAESVLTFRLLGIDAGASRAVERVGAAAEATGIKSATAAERSAAAWGKVGKAFNAVGKLSAAIVVGVAYEGVKAAANFEQAMARVHTQAGAPLADIKMLGDEVLKLSPKVGVGPTELADALYHVESAGFRAKGEVMQMVEAAAKLSQIGGSDIGASTQAIIGVMASGIKGVKDSMDAVALLNTTVGTGDMKMPQLVKAIGTDILPTAKAVGLSFEDIGAALATISDNATPADQVATRLKTALLTLIKPSKQQDSAFREMGMSSLQVANDFQQPNGLLVAVEDMKKHLDATYPAGQKTKLTLEQIRQASKSYYNDLVTQGSNTKDATKLTKAYTQSLEEGGSAAVLRANNLARALGGSKTAGIFLTLIGETERFASKYDAFGTSASRAAKLQGAWAAQQDTYKQKVAELKASWDVFLVKVGNAIIPTLKSLTEYLADHPGLLKNAALAVAGFAAAWTLVKIGSLVKGLGQLATAILGVGTASTTAAEESAAANLGAGAAGTAGAAGRAGLGARAAAGATRLIVPVAIGYVAVKALGLDKSLSDLIHGDFLKAGADGPKWTRELSSKLRSAFTGESTGPLSGVVAASFDPVKGGLKYQIEQINKQMHDLFDKGESGSPRFAALLKQVGDLQVKLGELDGKTPTSSLLTKATDTYRSALSGLGANIDVTSHALTGNTEVATTNRDALFNLVQKAKDTAVAYANTTNNAAGYNAVMALAIPQIEAEAVAHGLNRQQVDRLVQSYMLIPPSKSTTITAPGLAESLSLMQNYLNTLNNVPPEVSSVITTYKQEVAAGKATSLGGAAMGLSIPGFAKGTPSAPRGWARVGEHGPEMVRFSGGERVYNARDTAAMAGGSVTVNLNISTINASSFQAELRKGNLAQLLGAEIAKATSNR